MADIISFMEMLLVALVIILLIALAPQIAVVLRILTGFILGVLGFAKKATEVTVRGGAMIKGLGPAKDEEETAEVPKKKKVKYVDEDGNSLSPEEAVIMDAYRSGKYRDQDGKPLSYDDVRKYLESQKKKSKKVKKVYKDQHGNVLTDEQVKAYKEEAKRKKEEARRKQEEEEDITQRVEDGEYEDW